MTAASPASQSLAREQFRPNPATQQGRPEVRLTCPNPVCHSATQLYLIERVIATRQASFYDVGVTWPEVDTDDNTEKVSPNHDTRELLGIECHECRWSYTGPNPLAQLVRP